MKEVNNEDLDLLLRAELPLGRQQLEAGYWALQFWQSCREKYPVEELLEITDTLERIGGDLFDLHWGSYFLFHDDLKYILKFVDYVKTTYKGSGELRLLTLEHTDTWWSFQGRLDSWVDSFRKMNPPPPAGDRIAARVSYQDNVEAACSTEGSSTVLKVKIPKGTIGKIEIEVEEV